MPAWVMPPCLPDPQAAASLNWQEVRLSGSSAHDYAEQTEELGPTLTHGWQTKPSPKTGNPSYNLILASQP